MRRRSSWWLGCLPLALLGGCLLPSFENAPPPVEAEGGTESGGGGSGPAPSGGAGGEGGASNAGAAGVGDEPTPAAPQLGDDTFVVAQGRALKLKAASGVLANDRGAALRVTSFSAVEEGRPAAYDAELQIAEDGAVTFTPQKDFFGRYRVDYTVMTADEQIATARVTFLVSPVAASLDAVRAGVGGVVLAGTGGDELGFSIVGVGDVNADGFSDIALGAPGVGGGAGAVYVVFGRQDWTSFSLGSKNDGSADARFAVLTGAGSERIGTYVAAAGPYRSDAAADLLIGSPLGGRQAAEDGALYLVFGGKSFGGTSSLASLPRERGLVIEGQAFLNQRLGTLVAGAGDFDGDQQVDLLAGFNELGDAVRGLGLILETPAKDTSIDALAHATATDTTFVLPLSACFAGDVTGDGKDDILASSRASIVLLPGNGEGTLPSNVQSVSTDGSMYGFRLDRPSGATLAAPVAPAGDVNGDGKGDLVYCDGAANVTCSILFGDITLGRTLADSDWTVTGFQQAPAIPLLAPGSDLNQDDFSDLLFADETAAYVVFGREAGFGQVDVGSLGSDGFSLTAPSGGRIAAVATIGDVNGDGYGDFAASDPSAGGAGGRVYVVFGGPFAAEQR